MCRREELEAAHELLGAICEDYQQELGSTLLSATPRPSRDLLMALHYLRVEIALLARLHNSSDRFVRSFRSSQDKFFKL